MESKRDIRQRILQSRRRISEEVWKKNTHIICEKVVTHPWFLEAEVVYCYVDYQREVGTSPIIEQAWRLGKRVAVPKIDGDDMRFYYINDFTELSEGYKGILEPRVERLAYEKKALVIMPGAAFDVFRNRIGYGKGFYDRFLRDHPSCRTMAIAFELQMAEEIPAEYFDIRPDILITEERIYV